MSVGGQRRRLAPAPMSPEAPATVDRLRRGLDHKRIGRAYLWTAFGALLFGGLMAIAIRWQWVNPQASIPFLGQLTPSAYTALFTQHGLVMIFFAIGPLLMGAMGTLVLPLLVGARNLAFPRISRLSLWFYLASVGALVAGLFAPLGPANTGWTLYPPLSSWVGSPGSGVSWALLALILNGTSSCLVSANVLATLVGRRAPGMTFFRLPLTAWGLGYTALLNLMFLPILMAGGLLLMGDRLWGGEVFIAGAGARLPAGDPLLFQHLFWMFGHPQVYILILPAWGLIGDLFAHFARRPPHWYRATVSAMGAIVLLSGLVYAHHMFTVGLTSTLNRAFSTLTLLISLPSLVLYLNWLFTISRARVRLKSPMVGAICAALVFGLGGVTGLMLGAQTTDLQLHDTLWVVGHFHLTMGASSFLAVFAAIAYWFPRFTGRRMHEGWANLHLVGTAILFVAVFGLMHVSGWGGQHRRQVDPHDGERFAALRPVTVGTSHAAFLLGAWQLIFVGNFAWSLLRGPKSEQNPWEVGTLEWTAAPMPLPLENFPEIPTVLRGPHAYALSDLPPGASRDWIGQAERPAPSANPAPEGGA